MGDAIFLLVAAIMSVFSALPPKAGGDLRQDGNGSCSHGGFMNGSFAEQ
jgi:hypothetical protein